jgi:hypothetical protein
VSFCPALLWGVMRLILATLVTAQHKDYSLATDSSVPSNQFVSIYTGESGLRPLPLSIILDVNPQLDYIPGAAAILSLARFILAMFQRERPAV